MFEKKIQSALFVGFLLLTVSACPSQDNPVGTVADARAAALTNGIDDDKDGRVDENDEGLDEDEDGRVDESGEHHDACERRHHREDDSASGEDASDSDAGVEAEHAGDDKHGHHDKGSDSDSKSNEELSRDEKRAAEIAAIDCSDVPSTTDAGSRSDDTQDDKTPADAGL